MQHVPSFRECTHGVLFQQLAPFLVPRTLFRLTTTNRQLQISGGKLRVWFRLRSAFCEMVMLWGDVKETMEYPLTSLAKLAKENEHPAHMLLHTRMLWDMIKFLANVLQNNPDADKKYQRCQSRKLRQQPWHPVAGIVWSDKRCDSVFMKIMRKKEALELLLA
jgi:hypothetical protein